MIWHQYLVHRSGRIAAAVVSFGLMFDIGPFCDAPLWAADEPEAKFEEGWRRVVPLSEPDRNGKTEECIAWVQDGWLHVKRQTAAGDAQWHVVLARAAGATAPKIEVTGIPGTLRLLVSFRDGRYFVRDAPAVHTRVQPPRPDIPASLLCYREPKTPGAEWHHVSLPERDPKRPGYMLSQSFAGPFPCALARFESDSWYVVASGPAVDEADCMLRLCHKETLPPGGSLGRGGMAGANVTLGEAANISVIDDGEMLVARYVDEASARRLVGRPLERAKQIGVEAPELSGEKWFNTDHPLTLRDLRGKVVLLVFFNTNEARSISALRDLDELSAKYRDQGLVVLGVDAPKGTPDEAVRDHDLKLPFVVDEGETAKSYEVKAMPIYFSIRRDGTLTFVHKAGPPPARQIERLLERED